MSQDTRKRGDKQEAQQAAQQVESKLVDHLGDVLKLLNRHIDRRLVRTFIGLMLVLVIHRHRNQGLWLSELGGYLVPENAEAGRKRIEKLLYSRKWSSEFLEEALWQRGDARVQAGRQRGETVLAIWDESVLEKPESLKLENLGSVRSTKAVRLKRIKPGFFNPPGGPPIMVPGVHWLQVVVCGMKGGVVPAHLHFWTNRGDAARPRREEERDVLEEVADRWAGQVIHVWDRGFAGNPWLTLVFVHALRFVLRWPKHYRLVDEAGNEKKAWEIARGKRSWETRYLWDSRRRCHRKVGIVAFPVFDPTHHQPLWLVVSRQGPGKLPWYLLTSEPVHTPDQAWKIILIYARRWQIEMSIRFDKCELGFESLRVFSWEVRRRLLLMLALLHAFLLQFLTPEWAPLCTYLLNRWCHRNGKRSREVQAPLFRLRFALAFFWMFFPPPLLARLN